MSTEFMTVTRRDLLQMLGLAFALGVVIGMIAMLLIFGVTGFGG